ncbi:MAG: DUF2189 domain-containing protein [Hyphomonadaceae bacterium]|nr:DUF2189 domain-containing protein [Hyphomonadaceae bacterium]
MSDVSEETPSGHGEPPATPEPFKLPDVARIGLGAPFQWLAGGWADFQRAPLPCLIYGIILAAISAMIAWGLVFSGQFAWVFVLAGGFLIIGPMLAMGLYEAGRQLEAGDSPGFADMALVKGAFRLDLAYLGVALFLIYLLWTRIAQIVYALSTNTLHRTPMDFLAFMFTTPEGLTMAATGTVIGAMIAFLAYMLVVISAPMLLDQRQDVFIATITSIRAVTTNIVPMALWAVIIALLTAIGIATAFFGLIIVFPVIGLASWRAYRALLPGHAGA